MNIAFQQVLKFDLGKAGVLASLPPLVRLLFGFVFGQVGDTFRDRKIMSVTAIRKFFCIFCKSSIKWWMALPFHNSNASYYCILAHIIPGLLLIGITYIGNHPYWCVVIITASLGLNGASTLTNLQNSQDLAPNFAGSLYSVINFVGTSSGFISPMVVAYFTEERVCYINWLLSMISVRTIIINCIWMIVCRIPLMNGVKFSLLVALHIFCQRFCLSWWVQAIFRNGTSRRCQRTKKWSHNQHRNHQHNNIRCWIWMK